MVLKIILTELAFHPFLNNLYVENLYFPNNIEEILIFTINYFTAFLVEF